MFDDIRKEYLQVLLKTAGANSYSDMWLPRDDSSPFLLHNPTQSEGVLDRSYLDMVPDITYSWPEGEPAPRRIDCIYSLLGMQMPQIEGVLCAIANDEELGEVDEYHWRKLVEGVESGLENLLKVEQIKGGDINTPLPKEYQDTLLVGEAGTYQTLRDKVEAAREILEDEHLHHSYLQIRMAVPRRLVQLYRPMLGGRYELSVKPKPLNFNPHAARDLRRAEIKRNAKYFVGALLGMAVLNPDVIAKMTGNMQMDLAPLQSAMMWALNFGTDIALDVVNLGRALLPAGAVAYTGAQLYSACMLDGSRLALRDRVSLAPVFMGKNLPIDTTKLREETKRYIGSIEDRELQMRDDGLQLSQSEDKRQITDRRTPQITADAGHPQEIQKDEETGSSTQPVVVSEQIEDDTFLQDCSKEETGEEE